MTIEQMLTYGVIFTAGVVVLLVLYQLGFFTIQISGGDRSKVNLQDFFIIDYSYENQQYKIELGVIQELVLKNITINENYFEEHNGWVKPDDKVTVVGNTSVPPPLELKVYYELRQFGHIGHALLEETS